jgi:hypothetical protein
MIKKSDLTTMQKAALLLIDIAFATWKVRNSKVKYTAQDAFRAGYLKGQQDLIESLYPQGVTTCDKKS